MTHKITVFLFLLVSSPVYLRKLSATKDDKDEQQTVEIPKKANQRIGRAEALLSGGALNPSAYQYPLVLSPNHVDATSLTLAALAQNQRTLQAAAVAAASKQPKNPVYHASPLEPYGALLEHGSVQAVDSKPITEQSSSDALQYAADYGVTYHQPTSGRHGVPKLTQAVIPQPKYAPVIYKSHSSSHSGAYQEEDDQEKNHNYAAKYQFGYQVRDQKSASYFGHTEARDGHVTKGHYHVLLPDGRLQNVQYYADLSGFHAQVSYNGAAKHPPPKHYAQVNHQHQQPQYELV